MLLTACVRHSLWYSHGFCTFCSFAWAERETDGSSHHTGFSSSSSSYGMAVIFLIPAAEPQQRQCQHCELSELRGDSSTERSSETSMRPAEFLVFNWSGSAPYPCQELFCTTATAVDQEGWACACPVRQWQLNISFVFMSKGNFIAKRHICNCWWKTSSFVSQK